jgi:hypothetical protein
MRRWKSVVLASMIVILLSGCASSLNMKAVLENDQIESKINMLIEPYQSLGLKLTPAIKNQRAYVIQGVFPDILFGEYYPGRIRWNAWVVAEDGREYSAQMIFSGIDYGGNFVCLVVIDGKPPKDSRVVISSSLVDFVYDLAENETEVVRQKFLNDPAYRRPIVLAKGTKIGDIKPATKFYEVIKSWNMYKTPEGILISPIGEKEVREIAGINPQYSFSEKFVGITHGAISYDVIGSAIQIGIEAFRSSNGSVPTMGWDYNSQIPSRRNMAFIIKYVSEMKQRLIKQINRANAEIKMECQKNSKRR